MAKTWRRLPAKARQQLSDERLIFLFGNDAPGHEDVLSIEMETLEMNTLLQARATADIRKKMGFTGSGI
jgi:hypothetical protein